MPAYNIEYQCTNKDIKYWCIQTQLAYTDVYFTYTREYEKKIVQEGKNFQGKNLDFILNNPGKHKQYFSFEYTLIF